MSDGLLEHTPMLTTHQLLTEFAIELESKADRADRYCLQHFGKRDGWARLTRVRAKAIRRLLSSSTRP
ncbi:MAG: hypothetical protein AAF357_00295 [Verrucomicrobiota bacterium]